MQPKNILLFLLLLVVVSGLYGQKRPANNLFISKLRVDNPQTRIATSHVSVGVQPMDTIYHIEFATRVDSLFKYLNKYLKVEPKATWKIVFKSGINKPDLQTGDILRVTSENGTEKDYFLKLDNYISGTNAYLGSITWPDMPVSFKGDVAKKFGWNGDTIPSFSSMTMNYVLVLPLAYQQIPALTFSTQHSNSTVKVTRAKSLEGTITERTITFTVTAEDGTTTNVYSILLKKEQDTIDIQRKSTITSKFYKVSEGTSLKETIKGVTTGTTAAGFYANITKASELQTLKVSSSVSGAEKAGTDWISNGDTLLVISADGIHTTKYILDMISQGLSSVLTSANYTISIKGTTGTITGFPKYTLLKKVLAGVVIPTVATLTIVDQNDAYMTLVKLNFDTAYVNVIATSAVYFEVIPENGFTKILYQLLPTSNPNDAYVTSDVYSIDQSSSLLYYLRQGTSVSSLLRNVTPAPGATMEVYDKGGFVRPSGIIYRDDRLFVTSKNGSTIKVYYFKMPSIGIPYLAFVVSDDYPIDQISRIISGIPEGTSIAEFKSKLYPAVGCTLKVIDVNRKESTFANLRAGDQLVVTSADGTQTATFMISIKTGVNSIDVASTIRMIPNPTTDRIVVQGLEKGNRLWVVNASGIVIHDLIADSSTETISLDAQPGGIYIFVVSSGTHPIKIQKMVKQ